MCSQRTKEISYRWPKKINKKTSFTYETGKDFTSSPLHLVLVLILSLHLHLHLKLLPLLLTFLSCRFNFVGGRYKNLMKR